MMNPDDLTPGRDRDAERKMAEFLAGLPKDPVALMEALRQLDLLEEAKLAANCIFPVCVVHGDMESADDEQLIYGPDGLHARAARAGQYHKTQAGNDYTIWFFDGPGAERAAAAFCRAAKDIKRPWWNITETPYPVFDR
jgi:hypothetical protein